MAEEYEVNFLRSVVSALNNAECPGFEDNEGRIKFILRIIDPEVMKKLLSESTKIIEKSVKKSCDFRTKGNCFFNSTDGSKLDEAVGEYTKSVAHAPTGSTELALAYANRSAVLFKARLISDCLLDIERALQNNYPDNLKAKLYLRKAMCLQILKSKNDSSIKTAFTEAWKWAKKIDKEKQKIMKETLQKQEKVTSIDKSTFSKFDHKKFLPKLSSENPMIPGLSDAVELQYSKKYGRHVVAKRDIKVGEVLAVQKAYCAVVEINSRYEFCWNCGEQTWACIPCEKCVHVIFCSEICREKAMLEHHDIECPVIASLIALYRIKLDQPNVIFMPLRLAVNALKEMNNSFDTMRQSIGKIKAGKNLLLKGFTNNVFDPNKFSSVYCLLGYSNAETTVRYISLSISIAFLLATKTLYFGSRMNDDWETLSSKDDFVFVVALLEKLIGVSEMNGFGTHEKNIGFRLIIPALSFFNHSCIPMVARTNHNDHIANRSLRPIKKGEQIFCSYGPYYKLMPTNERRTYLSWYDFLCDCEACENDWSQETDVEKISKGVEMMSQSFSEAYWFISSVLKKYKKMKNHENLYLNSEKDLAHAVTSLQKFYRLHRQPNSLEIFLTRDILLALLSLTSDRVFSLN